MSNLLNQKGKGVYLKAEVSSDFRARVKGLAGRLDLSIGQALELLKTKSLSELEREIYGGSSNG